MYFSTKEVYNVWLFFLPANYNHCVVVGRAACGFCTRACCVTGGHFTVDLLV